MDPRSRMLPARVINSGLRLVDPPTRATFERGRSEAVNPPPPPPPPRVDVLALPMPPLYPRLRMYSQPRNLPPRAFLPIYAAQRCAMPFTGENMKTPLCRGELLLFVAQLLLPFSRLSFSPPATWLRSTPPLPLRLARARDIAYGFIVLFFAFVAKSGTIHHASSPPPPLPPLCCTHPCCSFGATISTTLAPFDLF